MWKFVANTRRFLSRLNSEMNHVCPVHREPFKKGTVPIKYGLIRYSEAYIRVRNAEFPWARSSVNGGCVHSEFSSTTANVEYCEQCRVNEAKWLEAQGPP